MTTRQDTLKEYLSQIYNALDFKPYVEQWPILLCEAREIALAGGEQAGKSTIASKFLMGRWDMGYDGQNSLLYWIAGKDYESTLKEFEYCVIDAQKLGFCISRPKTLYPDSLELILGYEGKEIARIKNRSLKDEMKIMAEAPNGIIIAEAAQITFSAFRKLQARVARSRGWIFLEGTFEGSTGWFPEVWQYYQTPGTDGESFSLPSWTNRFHYPSGREDPEIKRQEAKYPVDFFNERFAAIACKPQGVVIPEFQNRVHVGDYPFDKDLPVDITADPGFFGASSLHAIQSHGDQIWIVGEVYLHGRVTEEIIDVCKLRPWWQNRKSPGTIDIAARQHQAMASPEEAWREMAGMLMTSRKVNINGGIDLLRRCMKPHPITNRPPILIDHSCLGLICEMGGGKPPELNNEQSKTHNDIEKWGAWTRDLHTGKPLDKYNHACKDIIYYLANKHGYREFGMKTERKVKHYF